jgi:hypothetical protein
MLSATLYKPTLTEHDDVVLNVGRFPRKLCWDGFFIGMCQRYTPTRDL